MKLAVAGGNDIQVSEATFGREFSEALVHQVVTAYLAGARSGTKAQKNRSAVRGGGKKPWRQKGTGRARAGTIRSPIWRGGGKVFPAATQNFAQKVNRKMYRGGMRAILSELLRSGRLTMVDALDVAEPKTRLMVEMLDKLGKRDVLLVTEEPSAALVLAARNIPHVTVIDVEGLNPYSLVRHGDVVMTTGAAKKVEGMLA